MSLSIEYVSVKELQEQQWHRNPKDHAIGDIVASMKRFGFTAPILHDTTSGRMVAGHGRLEAAVAIMEELRPHVGGASPFKGMDGFEPDGWALKGIQVGPLEEGHQWYLPVVRGLSFADADQAEAYVLADNRLTEMGGWREDKLDEIFRDWKDREVDLVGTGFSDAAVRRIMRLNDPERFAGRTPADKLDGFLDAEMKQVVLYFSSSEYDGFIDNLDKLASYLGVDSNTAVIERLVEKAVGELGEA